MNEEISIEYIAGFFDGEGGVYITQRKDKRCKIGHISRNIRCQFTNCNLDILHKLQKQIGGTIRSRIRVPKQKPCYGLELDNQRKILEFLKQVCSHLQIKREQTEIAIKYLESRLKHQHKSYTKEEKELTNKIRKLTKRGT